MALQMNYYYSLLDTTIYNVYWRINPINGIVGGKDNMNYVIEGFKNVEMSHADNQQPINRITYWFVPNMSDGAPNFIAQAYNDAKSRPYFNGSVDV